MKLLNKNRKIEMQNALHQKGKAFLKEPKLALNIDEIPSFEKAL